jgi:hypothetical protein
MTGLDLPENTASGLGNLPYGVSSHRTGPGPDGSRIGFGEVRTALPA